MLQLANMVFGAFISAEQKAYVCLLKEHGLSVRNIVRKSNVSRTSVHRICKAPIRHIAPKTRTGGRKRSLTSRQERLILRNVNKLRLLEGGFSSRRLMEVSGLLKWSKCVGPDCTALSEHKRLSLSTG